MPTCSTEQIALLEELHEVIWAHPNHDAEFRLTLRHGPDLKVVKIKGVDRMTTMVKPAGI